MFIPLIDLLAVPCNTAKLEIGLGIEFRISFLRDFLTCGHHIDQSANQTGLRIGDFDRLVCGENQEALELIGISTAELLIDHHGLMRHQ